MAAPSFLPLAEVPQQVVRPDAGRLFERLDDLPQVVVADALDAPAYLGSKVRRYFVFEHRFLVGWNGQSAIDFGQPLLEGQQLEGDCPESLLCLGDHTPEDMQGTLYVATLLRQA